MGSVEVTHSESEKWFVPEEEALLILHGFATAETSCRRAASSTFPRAGDRLFSNQHLVLTRVVWW